MFERTASKEIQMRFCFVPPLNIIDLTAALCQIVAGILYLIPVENKNSGKLRVHFFVLLELKNSFR